ncbi:MAG: DUF1836 domain-containing protein [Lachnospiraceae bacterium]|nr:DUF1836 domain-containing protein [Lachnospiraceae bacterium]
MTIKTEDLLNSIMESFDRIAHIESEDIPNIDLYMDQVTTFMERNLRSATRNPGEDKILTKTMINNYAKNDLLPPPVKKKYSKEHVLMLIFIYYFKGVLSIGDIQKLLNPLAEKYFQSEDGFTLTDVYDEVFRLEEMKVEGLKADVRNLFAEAEKTFPDAAKDDREFLQRFALICMLSYDVYVKKLLIEKLIDATELPEDKAAVEPEKKKTKAEKK